MPRYDFQCSSCSYTFEEERPFGEKKTPACPQCGKETDRLISPPNIHFKGDGFYNTDNAKKPPKPKPLDSAQGKEIKTETPKAEKPQPEANLLRQGFEGQEGKDSPKDIK
ncbi:zinc ribbon domain-containing protein [Patescibacteria group bacterium]|nr:zinc ribbon domain-containing protein [Patescibacteria group bacterium]